MTTTLLLSLLLAAAPASDFWAHWGDGQAELAGYRLTQPRYGQQRDGTAVLVYVTEGMLDRERIKPDRPRTDGSSFPVMKLNALREFQTGIYDYHVMTSVFARVARDWPLAKVSFSSQEWCGLVHHQLLARDGAIEQTWHSYFEGEADGAGRLPQPADGVFEDALPILVRDLRGDWIAPGESRTVPLLRSLLHARLAHTPLAWGQATISREATSRRVETPAGRFEVSRTVVALPDGEGELTYDVEVASPHRLIRWTGPQGEEAVLLGSDRLAYWKLNGPEGEKALRALGLAPVSRRR